jgi:hypothetical protein
MILTPSVKRTYKIMDKIEKQILTDRRIVKIKRILR